MTQYFVPYKLSIELRNLGFDEKCMATTDETQYIHIKGTKSLPRGSMCYDTVSSPLYDQAFDWFREKHGLISYLHPFALLEDTNLWCYEITNFKINFDEDRNLKSYQEARQACLEKLIEIAQKTVKGIG